MLLFDVLIKFSINISYSMLSHSKHTDQNPGSSFLSGNSPACAAWKPHTHTLTWKMKSYLHFAMLLVLFFCWNISAVLPFYEETLLSFFFSLWRVIHGANGLSEWEIQFHCSKLKLILCLAINYKMTPLLLPKICSLQTTPLHWETPLFLWFHTLSEVTGI